MEIFEIWCYRKILRISWTNHVTYNTVLQRINKKLEMKRTIERRKLEYLGHVMRGTRYKLLRLLKCKQILKGPRSIGRRRFSWLRNLRKRFGKFTSQLFRRVVDKVRLVIMISKLHQEKVPQEEEEDGSWLSRFIADTKSLSYFMSGLMPFILQLLKRTDK